MSLKHFAVTSSLIACLILGASVHAADINIYFKTTPLLEQLRPYGEPASLSVLATAVNGKPLTSGWVTIALDAPPRGRFFSTDFPWVEGSKLAELRLPLKAGKAEWKYLFPIRGHYRMSIEVVTADGPVASKVFNFTIRENRSKWLTLGIFILALFLLGFVAGRIFSASAVMESGTAVVALIIATTVSPVGLANAQGLTKPTTARLEIDPPAVGRATGIRWELQEHQSAAKGALLSLTVMHLEKNKIVFTTDRIAVERQYSMNFQFTDGAQYRVTAYAEVPGANALRAEQIVTVTGVEPPAGAMIPPIAFFLLVIALGLVLGRWSRKRARS